MWPCIGIFDSIAFKRFEQESTSFGAVCAQPRDSFAFKLQEFKFKNMHSYYYVQLASSGRLYVH